MKDDRLNLYFNFSETAGILTVVIGLFALTGWVFSVPLMKSVLPGLIAMKANSAICFVLSGVALWCLQTKQIDNQYIRILGRSCAFVTASIGALTLYEYFSGNNLCIDQLLFREPNGAVFTTYPGRMVLITAANFFLSGLALLSLDIKSKLEYYPSQFLALIAGFTTLLALYGYIYGVSGFFGKISAHTAMALHTVIAFIFLCLGILFARPDKGLSSVITSPLSGGIIMRRLSLMIIAIPTVLGWLKLQGEKAGFYNSQFGTTLTVITNVALLTVIVWWTAALINRIEKKRKTIQIKLDAANEEWKLTFDSMSDPAFIIDMDNTIRNVNSALTKMLAKSAEEIIGKKCYEIMHELNSPFQNCPMERTKNDSCSHSEEVNDPHIGIPLLVTTSPIFDRNNKMVGVVHVAKDISGIKKAEAALRESEIKYSIIFDSVPAWIFYKDKENHFVRVNKVFADLMQMSKEDLEGRSSFDLFPHEQAESYWKDDKEIIDSGKPKINIIEMMDTKKGRIWVHTDKMPYRNEKGEIVGVIGFSMDITERKLAEDALVKKVRDMEIFYKAAIDREMKIKELKRKIDQLEAKMRS